MIDKFANKEYFAWIKKPNLPLEILEKLSYLENNSYENLLKTTYSQFFFEGKLIIQFESE